MAATKRSKIQIEQDRADVLRYRLQGYTIQEIADKTGNSTGMVDYDLDSVREAWQKQTQIDLDEAKQRELAKLDMLELTHWRGWDIKKNPAHLDGVLKCIAQRAKMLGLNEPQLVLPGNLQSSQTNVLQVFNGEVTEAALNAANEQALAMLQELNDQHREAGIGHYRSRPALTEFDGLVEEGLV